MFGPVSYMQEKQESSERQNQREKHINGRGREERKREGGMERGREGENKAGVTREAEK